MYDVNQAKVGSHWVATVSSREGPVKTEGQTHPGDEHVKTEAEIGTTKPQAKECQQKLREGLSSLERFSSRS